MTELPSQHRFNLLTLLAGLASALLLSFTMTNTLSRFFTLPDIRTGTVALVETSSGISTCDAAVTTTSCETLLTYGDALAPSDSNTSPTKNIKVTTMAFGNAGTAAASGFTLTPGTCIMTTTDSPPDTCTHFYIKVVSGGCTIYLGTLTAFTDNQALSVPAANSSSTTTITFTTWLDNGASNSYQGTRVSQPLKFTLNT